jgi:hypothetical protein
MVQNPSDSKNIEFRAIYHSSDYDHCEMKQTGVIYSEVIEDRACLSFSLTKLEKIEIFATRLDLGNLHIAFLLCNNLVLQH